MTWTVPMDSRPLHGTDLDLSVLGFGAAPLGNEYGTLDQSEAIELVHLALDEGINYFDTSPYYGRTLSEARLGEALDGVRERTIISTKAGRYDWGYPEGFNFSYDRISRSVDESLRRLRTTYVDIVYLHDIEFTSAEMVIDEALPALADARDAGKIRFVGVSGFPLEVLLETVATAAVDVVLSYCHGDLLDSSVADRLSPVAESHGCGVITASPMHMGLLSPVGPPPWHPAGPDRRLAAQALASHCEGVGVSLAAAAISYACRLPGPASVLAGVSTVQQLRDNIAALDNPVDPAVLADLVAIRDRLGGEPWPSGIR